jgi:probable rRNA maturation factor
MTPTRRHAPPQIKPRKSGRLTVEIVVPGGNGAPGLAGWLERIAPAAARGEVAVAIVSDRRIQELNRRYRNKNAPTDVLSFPADEPGQLGDIVIALGVARRQARTAGHTLSTELRILALHGLLHLLGYDHERDTGEMRRLEQHLRRAGGLREGLIEREARRSAR